MKRGRLLLCICLAGLGWAQPAPPCQPGEREPEPARQSQPSRAIALPMDTVKPPGPGEIMPCAPAPSLRATLGATTASTRPRPVAQREEVKSPPALRTDVRSTPTPSPAPSPFSPSPAAGQEPFAPRVSPSPTVPNSPAPAGTQRPASGPAPGTTTPLLQPVPALPSVAPAGTATPSASLEASRTRTLPAPPPLPDSTVVTEKLTYDQAPLLALARNPRIPAALASVREALATSKVTGSPANWRGELSLQGPPIPQSQDGTSSFRNDYVLSPVRLEIRKLIYDGGRILAAVQRDRALARQYGNLAQEDWNLLTLQVRRAYLAVLTQRGSVSLAQEQVGLAREQLQQAEVRVKVGSAPRGDVLSAALPVAQAELGVTRNQGNYNKSVQELNSLLGLSPDTRLELEEPPLPQQPLPDLATCMQQAMAQRPSIEGMRNQLRSALRGVEAAQLDNHPYINILLGTAAVSQDEKIIGGLTYRGGFEAVWPFWDGSKTKYLSELARAKVDNAAALVKQEMDKVRLEVSDAYRSLQLSVEAHKTQQQRVLKAQDALRIAQFQYKAGMITPYPVRQAQADLYEARQAEVQAYFDYFVALAQLDFACGRVPAALEIPQHEGEPDPEPEPLKQ